MVWTESPTNPLMKVVDLKELAVISKAMTRSASATTRSIARVAEPSGLGVDLVVHSTTKYIGGHADLLGGAIVMNREDLHEKLKFARTPSARSRARSTVGSPSAGSRPCGPHGAALRQRGDDGAVSSSATKGSRGALSGLPETPAIGSPRSRCEGSAACSASK